MSGEPSDMIAAWNDVSSRAARSTRYRARPAAAGRRAAGLSLGATIVALAIVATALVLRPGAGPSATGAVVGTASDGVFRVDLTVPRGQFAPSDPITPVATVTYLGPAERIDAGHATNPMTFRIEEVGGDRLMPGGSRLPCVTTTLTKDVPFAQPFSKSGSPDVGGFDIGWYRDPVLRLPVGTWRIIALLDVTADDAGEACRGDRHQIAAEVVVIVGDAPAPSANVTPVPSVESGRVIDRVDDGTFRLELTTAHATYAPTDPIEPAATLTYLGPAAEIGIWHGDPAISFSIEEVDGKRTMSGGVDDSCNSTNVSAGTPIVTPFAKSGQIGNGFDETWFRDPVLGLPIGTWRIHARLVVDTTDGTRGCGGIRHDLTATVTVQVIDPSASPAPPVPTPSANPAAPSATAGAIGPIHAAVICRLGSDSCDSAIALVRRAHPAEVDGALEIVIADTCPPPALCDRLYPFDSLVVLVPAPPDSASLTAYEVVGLAQAPEKLLPSIGPLPAHIAALVPDPSHQASDDSMFRIELMTEPKTFDPASPIAPVATLTYVGPDGQVTFGHSVPAVFFTIEEIGGSRQMTGGAADSCSSTTLQRGAPSAIPFAKGGGLGYGFDDAWLRDPVLRLPPGTCGSRSGSKGRSPPAKAARPSMRSLPRT